ncbi:hypothetical protein A4244_02855 [Bacillus badius]|nr:hypothetical protein A4244_02855 [Bacillus badius]OCS88223.1 hypothetical protein A6M11_02855 [Bacillus badius]OVE53248.1 hypothetical protein B1A98_00055 [Bacillus badius]
MLSIPGCFAFRGAGGEPPRRQKRLRGLACPADPAGVFAPSISINRMYKRGQSYNHIYLKMKYLYGHQAAE